MLLIHMLPTHMLPTTLLHVPVPLPPFCSPSTWSHDDEEEGEGGEGHSYTTTKLN